MNGRIKTYEQPVGGSLSFILSVMKTALIRMDWEMKVAGVHAKILGGWVK
jgi:hypothetical protein